MKDEHDKRTLDPVPPAKPFNYFGKGTLDQASREAERPECAVLHPVPEVPLWQVYFVPVAFVAKDWNVTPRRVRFLLTAGRLAGRRNDNGYWEVAHPYRFTFGTRGPALKRSQKVKKDSSKRERTTA